MIIPKQFYKKTAEELKKDIGLVESVNKFYWKTVKDLLVSCEYEGLYIKNLGTFYGSEIKTRLETVRVVKKLKGLRRKKDVTSKEENTIKMLTKKLKPLLRMRNRIALQRKNKTAQKWEW